MPGATPQSGQALGAEPSNPNPASASEKPMGALDYRIGFTFYKVHVLRVHWAALAAGGEGARERDAHAHVQEGASCAREEMRDAFVTEVAPNTAFLKFLFFFFQSSGTL